MRPSGINSLATRDSNAWRVAWHRSRTARIIWSPSKTTRASRNDFRSRNPSKPEAIRFLRTGTHPALRGTYVKFSDRETLLFTVGYVPEYRQYPGAKNPEPILLRHDRGDSTRETICNEVMALTKLNWNSCAYAAKQLHWPLRSGMGCGQPSREQR